MNEKVLLWKHPEYRRPHGQLDQGNPAGVPVPRELQDQAVHGAGGMWSPLLTISVNCDTMLRGTCGGTWTWGCCPK